MENAQFWQLIEDARVQGGDECKAQANLLKSSLLLLQAGDVVEFDRLFNGYRMEAYRWDLWGAAYLINGGCSDDGFEYFRWWLIGQGQAVFEGALANPDNLADLLTDNLVWSEGEAECEAIGYVAMEVYQEKTGKAFATGETGFLPGEPIGVRWEEDDLDALYPKIVAKIDAQETLL